MSRAVPPILSLAEFSHAELSAARLDGDIVAVDECWRLIDEHDGRLTRARSIASILPPRVIVERMSAAWVLGARDDPPAVHELCVDSAARYSRLGLPRQRIREVVITADELTTVGPVRVTTPLRTAIDIARFSTGFTATEDSVVASLIGLGGFTVDDVVANLEARRNLPAKVLARERLVAAFEALDAASSSGQPAETR